MSTFRTSFLISATPLIQVPKLTLYADTWQGHILKRHPEMLGKEALIEQVVSQPTTVGTSNQNPNYIVFVNDGVTSTSGGSLLAVYADPVDAVIATAFYQRSFTVSSEIGVVLWPV